MSGSSPVKSQKARGLAAQKQKVPLPVETDEYDDAIRQTEADLEKYRLGHVKLYRNFMTFEWAIGTNRPIADEARSANLREHMRNGIFRADPMHRMSGCIALDAFNKGLHHPALEKAISAKEVSTFNKNAEFPVLKLKPEVKVEMQSGQHRMQILSQLRPEEKDQWWIVTIYDESKLEPHNRN